MWRKLSCFCWPLYRRCCASWMRCMRGDTAVIEQTSVPFSWDNVCVHQDIGYMRHPCSLTWCRLVHLFQYGSTQCNKPNLFQLRASNDYFAHWRSKLFNLTIFNIYEIGIFSLSNSRQCGTRLHNENIRIIVLLAYYVVNKIMLCIINGENLGLNGFADAVHPLIELVMKTAWDWHEPTFQDRWGSSENSVKHKMEHQASIWGRLALLEQLFEYYKNAMDLPSWNVNISILNGSRC